MNWIIIAGVSLIGAIVQGVSGMGYSMIGMAILVFFAPYKDLSVSLKILSLMFAIPIFLKQRKDIRVKTMMVPLLFATIGSMLGYYLFKTLDEALLSKMLGALLVIISAFLLLYKKEVIIAPTKRNGSIAGILSGFSSCACGVPGPPLAIYYINTIKNDKDGYFATIVTHFFLISVFQVAMLGVNGDITPVSLTLTAGAFVPTVVGYAVGRKIFDRTNTALVIKIVYLVMLVMGIFLFVS